MTSSQNPTITRRRLRIELRRLRETANHPLAEVTKTLDWSTSKLIRIENGSVSISVTDLRALLEVYETPAEIVEDLVALARSARERRWWSHYREFLTPQYQEFIGFEADAARLRLFQPTMVPGLFQTAGYARALIPAVTVSPLPEWQVDGLVEVRLRRQKEIMGADLPPEITVVLDEAVVRRPVGGAETMRAQLEHLAEAQAHPTVTVAVVPFSAGPHMGLQGPFQVLDFADDVDGSVLYLEYTMDDMAIRENAEQITEYDRHLDHLLARSLQGDAAADFLRQIAKEIG